MENLGRGIKEVEDWISKEEEECQKAEDNIVEKLKGQLQNVKDTMESLKQEHGTEISTISESYLSRMTILKEKEENALLEIESLRSQLTTCTASLDKLRNLSELEVKLRKEKAQLLASVEVNLEKREDMKVPEIVKEPVIEKNKNQSRSAKALIPKKTPASSAKKAAKPTVSAKNMKRSQDERKNEAKKA